MLILQAVILGIVQGLTEFIPVSSSGHLVAIPILFHWRDMGQTFDVALHLGTLVALLAFFWKDWVCILRSFGTRVLSRTPYEKQQDDCGRLLVPIIVASIPAGVVGFLWDKKIEGLRNWHLILIGVAVVMVAIAAVMLIAERLGKKKRDVGSMNYIDYVSIGCAQALALFPGVSRSGITISTGLFRGLNREAAARFSFLLSTPAILGAGLLKLKDLAKMGLPADEKLPFIIGFITAAVFGYVAIGFLMRFLRTRSLNAFVIYRVLFAAVLLAVFFLKVS